MENLRGYATFDVVGKVFIGDKSILRQHKVEDGKDPWAKIQVGISDGTSTIYLENSASRTKTAKFKISGKDGVTKEYEVKRPALTEDGKGCKLTDSTDPLFTALKKDTDDLKQLGYQYRKILKLNPVKDEDGKITHTSDITFIDNYDFVDTLIRNAEVLKDKLVRVKGNISFDEYNGNSKQVYQFSSIEEVFEDEDIEQDVPLQLEIPFVVDKNCASAKDFNYEKLSKMQQMDRLVPYSVYVPRYDKSFQKNMLWKETFMIDLSGLSFEEEKKEFTEKMLEMYIKLYVPNIKEGVYQDGVAVVEYFSAKSKVTLDDMEKMMIQAGFITESALIKEKQANIKGEKQTMLKFRRFRANGTLVTNKSITDKDHWIFEESDKANVQDTSTKGNKKKDTKKAVETPVVDENVTQEVIVEEKVEKVEAPKATSEFVLDL